MKSAKIILVLSCLFLSQGLAFPGDKISATRAFSLVISGGYASSSFGDLNATLGSINSIFDSVRETSPDRVVGEILRVPNLFAEWEAEVRWTKDRFGIGIAAMGTGSIHQQSSLTYTIVDYAGIQIEKRGNISDIRFMPSLSLNLYYSWPIRSGFELSFSIGSAYYRAHMRFDQSWDSLAPAGDRGKGDDLIRVSGAAVGFHFKCGLEYRFSDRLSVLLGGRWRFARIGELSGDVQDTSYTYDTEGNLIRTESNSAVGNLYHLIEDDNIVGERVEKFVVRDSSPEWGIGYPSDIRRAFIDLTGPGFEIGFRIRLF
jgi:opacity protein-like surface antigen